MSANRRKAFLVSALLVGCALTVTACEDPEPGGAKDSSSASSPASGETGGSGDAEGAAEDKKDGEGKGPGGGDSAQGDSGAEGSTGKCRTDDLKITAKDVTDSSEPNATVAVELKNSSGRDCVIDGFARVVLRSSEGAFSAKRTGGEADTFVLKNGKSTYFAVGYPANDSGGSGVRVTSLVVTPPDGTKAVTLDWPGGSLPVSDDAGSPVTVGKPGGIGQG